VGLDFSGGGGGGARFAATVAAAAEGEYGGGAAAKDGDELGGNFPEPKGAGGGGGDFLTNVLLEEVARETAVADDAVDGERPTDAEPGLNARFWEMIFAERIGAGAIRISRISWAGRQAAYTWK
jgi:hypothetical protein